MVPWNRRGNNRKTSSAINVLQSYAQTPAELDLFQSDSSVPLSYLKYREVLAAFPDGSVPQQSFKHKALQWRLQSSSVPGSNKLVHLAVLQPSSHSSNSPGKFLAAANSSPGSIGCLLDQQDSEAAFDNSRKAGLPRVMSTPEGKRASIANSRDGLGGDYALQQYGADSDVAASPYTQDHYSNGSHAAMGYQNGHSNIASWPGSYGSGQMQQQHHPHLQHQQSSLELERRKFTRNLLNANNKKESLERYKAIMSLIESCKRRLVCQLPPCVSVAADHPWASEPMASLLQSALDVGEALASFGNCHFPEHSNEARAILAGDYRALLRQYLSNFGFLFAAPVREQLSHDMQEEVQSVGTLLATRCEAYDILYDQLVRHVGLEGRGGPSTLVLNHNTAAANPTTSITANPTNTTTATSSAQSSSKAVNKGLGAAAIAAAGLGGLLILKVLRGGGGGGRGRGRLASSSGNGSQQQGQQWQRLKVPKGKNGRELWLVGQLSACGDELGKARRNDELLRDDWRLGRHVRLAWPPGPTEPPGYEALDPDACNVSQVLQELYV